MQGPRVTGGPVASENGHPYPSMQLMFWGRYQSPECDGIVCVAVPRP